QGLELAFFALLGATLLARWLRTLLGGTYHIRHASGRVISAPIGRTILEAVRDAGLPHASVCGGRARCTTCRVRVVEGLTALPPPLRAEAQALARIEAPPNVRLACQTRPRADVAIVPLLPPEPGAAAIHSAIGDNINIAARFEGMTKAYHCVLVVSADTLAQAGLDPHGAPLHGVRVRGRSERITVYAISDPRTLFQ